MAIYGYCRISTQKQSIERQIRNIRSHYPKAIIFQEVYTGTKTDGRKKWEQLRRIVQAGDIIVFDSVSRMSRNAAEGFETYQKLFDAGIELVFLKEPHINTTVYKKALNNHIAMTGTKTDIILKAVNEYLMELAKEQADGEDVAEEMAEYQYMLETLDLSKDLVDIQRTINISSSYIRNLYKNKKQVYPLVPKDVDDYIKKHNLYI